MTLWRGFAFLSFGSTAIACAQQAATITPCGLVEPGWAAATFVCIFAAVWSVAA